MQLRDSSHTVDIYFLGLAFFFPLVFLGLAFFLRPRLATLPAFVVVVFFGLSTLAGASPSAEAVAAAASAFFAFAILH